MGMAKGQAVAVAENTPEDVATLYSWANLRGARYRDFSATRTQVREEARQRVQEAIEAERRRAAEPAAVPILAVRSIQAAPAPAAAPTPALAAAPAETARAAESIPASETRAANPSPNPLPDSLPEAPAIDDSDRLDDRPVNASPANAGPVNARPVLVSSAAAAAPQEFFTQPSVPSAAPQSYVSSLASPAVAPQPVLPSQPQQPLAARWFALSGIFPSSADAPAHVRHRIPALATFSLAGGVGKSSLVATLGRALAAQGERILLVDTSSFGMLPFFFGSRDQRQGVLRTFAAPNAEDEGARIEILALDTDRFGPEGSMPEPATQEILRHGGSASRILIDLATASGSTIRRILRMTPTVLVPVAPDVGSVASVGAIESFFQRNNSGTGQPVIPYYVLSQFDEELRLHQDVREVLRGQLGGRLLPVTLRRSPAVSEALAEGMTVMDYAPTSPAAEDFRRLAAWVRSQAAPADSAQRGARWSER
jgi:cellulose synthase operon protein YhjQ